MDVVHRLNEAEIADALSGKPVDERIADCKCCATEFAEWTELGNSLRRDLDARAEMPGYFWTRQQAQIRERLATHGTQLRWAAAAMFALILLAFGLIRNGATPEGAIAQAAPKSSKVQTVPADPDDALLRKIQASLQREVPAPLAPVAMLVEEVASASNQAQQVKEN